jgi:hypothetical protein
VSRTGSDTRSSTGPECFGPDTPPSVGGHVPAPAMAGRTGRAASRRRARSLTIIRPRRAGPTRACPPLAPKEGPVPILFASDFRRDSKGRGEGLSSEMSCNPATASSALPAARPDRHIGGPFARAGLARGGCKAPRNPLQPRNRRRSGVRPLCVSRCPVRRLRRVRKWVGRVSRSSYRATCFRATCHRTSTCTTRGGRWRQISARAGLIPPT